MKKVERIKKRNLSINEKSYGTHPPAAGSLSCFIIIYKYSRTRDICNSIIK
jgi:hypothetical protein